MGARAEGINSISATVCPQSAAALLQAVPHRRSWCRCGGGEPSPGADVARGEPNPGADVAEVSPESMRMYEYKLYP